MNVRKLLTRAMLSAAVAGGTIFGLGNAASAYPGRCAFGHECYDDQLYFPDGHLNRNVAFYFHAADTSGHKFILDSMKIEHNDGNPACNYAVEVLDSRGNYLGGNVNSGPAWKCAEPHNLKITVPDTAFAYVYLLSTVGNPIRSIGIGEFDPTICGPGPSPCS